MINGQADARAVAVDALLFLLPDNYFDDVLDVWERNKSGHEDDDKAVSCPMCLEPFNMGDGYPYTTECCDRILCNACVRAFTGKPCPFTYLHNMDDPPIRMTLDSFQPLVALANNIDLANRIQLDYPRVYKERRAFVETLAALRLQDREDQAATH